MIKKVIIIASVVIAIVIIAFTSGMIYLHYGQKEINKTEIQNVDLSNVEDGTYIGEFEGYRWSNKVEVTVKNHQITNIKIINNQVFNKPEVSEELFNSIKEEQSLDVDTVSGATISSKAYLKAIENALKN